MVDHPPERGWFPLPGHLATAGSTSLAGLRFVAGAIGGHCRLTAGGTAEEQKNPVLVLLHFREEMQLEKNLL